MRTATFTSITIFLVSFISAVSWAQCPMGFDSVRLEIDPDRYFTETSWSVYEKSDPSIIYISGTVPSDSSYVFDYCIPQGGCKVFAMADDNGDGMIEGGTYRVYVNGTLIRSSINYYGFGENTDFGCPPGFNCNSAITMTLGDSTTLNGAETWYSFIPAETGIYNISTCGAACPAKIWMYDRCNDLILTENLVGTIFYADSGCPDSSASATVYLAAGKEYFIRMRYAVPECSTEPLPYSTSYLGPIIGCMDPTACNYEPLATVSSGICLYPGDPNCPQAPDIEIDQNVLISSLEFSDHVSSNPCLVAEGCLRGYGQRQIIEFTTLIRNVGNADYFVGAKPTNPSDTSTQFIYDPCHGHWHILGYAEYVLYNSAGKLIPIGSKNGFCMLDAGCELGAGPRKYKCDNMGITVDCFDVYVKKETDCQWIDITGIPADNYTLVARVNWDKSPDKIGRVEKTFDNNWAQACFTLLYDGDTPEVIFNTDTCKQYTDCTGVVFGDAQPDCNGICNGPSRFGDWNLDTLQNAEDVRLYTLAALANSGEASPCNDLNDDGNINVYDAALLQECTLHADSQQYWLQRFPCQFPGGIYNPQDLVTIRAGALDTLAKTFDIEMVNPFNPILAYEFSVSGLVIDSITNLDTGYFAKPIFNAVTNEILALAGDESKISKHNTPSAFLRVHYAALTDHMVCVSGVTAVVNHKYQQCNAILGDPVCVPVNYVAVKEPNNAAFAVFVQPNPMDESTMVFFDNKAAAPMQFTLTDLMGRTLRSFHNIYGESISIERGDLPEGTYIFTLSGNQGTVSGKIIIR